MRSRHLVVLAATIVAVISCGGSGSGGGGGGSGGGTTGPGNTCTSSSTNVCLTDANTFSPASLTVPAGTVVSWTNLSGVTHNVTFTTAGAPDNIPDFASGAPTRAFPTAGTYHYNCTIHGLSMSGTIIVQ